MCSHAFSPSLETHILSRPALLTFFLTLAWRSTEDGDGLWEQELAANGDYTGMKRKARMKKERKKEATELMDDSGKKR